MSKRRQVYTQLGIDGWWIHMSNGAGQHFSTNVGFPTTIKDNVMNAFLRKIKGVKKEGTP